MLNIELLKNLRASGYEGEVDLASLIEACGDQFGALLRVPTGKWQAMGGQLEKSKIEGQGIYTQQFLGESPEIAVARLYLALNAKD